MGHTRFHVCILQCLFNIPLKFIWLGPKCSWKKLVEIFYSSISLRFLLIFSKLSKVWICISYISHIPDFLNARKCTNKVVMKISIQLNQVEECQGVAQIFFAISPILYSFSPHFSKLEENSSCPASSWLTNLQNAWLKAWS